MRRTRVLLLTLCAVFWMFASPVSPASAKPLPPSTGQLCFPGAGELCDFQWVYPGTGEDLHMILGNQCVGPSVCENEVILTGNFDRVVIDRANDCTNGATCSIIVNPYGASFNSIQFRDGSFRTPFGPDGPTTVNDSCDATSVCTKSPAPQPPITELDDGGVCVTDQVTVGDCLITGTTTGHGQNLHLVLGNKCSVAVSCAEEFWLTGSFNNVVIDRANNCSNGATCTITVHLDAEINSLQINDGTIRTSGISIKDRCDATAVCTKSP